MLDDLFYFVNNYIFTDTQLLKNCEFGSFGLISTCKFCGSFTCRMCIMYPCKLHCHQNCDISAVVTAL